MKGDALFDKWQVVTTEILSQVNNGGLNKVFMKELGELTLPASI